jgi:hypothetical protein
MAGRGPGSVEGGWTKAHLRVTAVFDVNEVPEIDAAYEPANEYQKQERASIEIKARERVVAIGCHDAAGFVAALRAAADSIERQMGQGA